MIKRWRYVALLAVALLAVMCRKDVKDGLVAAMIWVQCNVAKEGKSYDSCSHLYEKMCNDWWYVDTALRRFDLVTYRTCLDYQQLLLISSLPGLTERMISDYEAKMWSGSKELAGAMILFHRTGDIRYLRRMFDVVLCSGDELRNERARRYKLGAALSRLAVPIPDNVPFSPRSSDELPDEYWHKAYDEWQKGLLSKCEMGEHLDS